MQSSSTQNQNGIFVRTTLDFRKDLKVHKMLSSSHLAVKNSEMIVTTSEKTFLRQSVSSSDRQEMTLPINAPDAIAHVHLAFTGFHAILSTRQGNNFYLHTKTNTVHHLKKLKCVVTSVGWNPQCLKESETGPILLGTQQGSMIELSLSSSGLCHVMKELTPQLAFDQPLTTKRSPHLDVVSDIQLFVTSEEDSRLQKWLAIITQPTRLIVLTANVDSSPPPRTSGFTSSASLQAGFMNLPETPQTFFHPFFTSKESQYHVVNPSKSSEKFSRSCFMLHPASDDPKRFVWLSSDGIVIGKVDVSADRIQDVLIEEFNMEHRLIEGRIEPPVDVVLTDYHIVLAYSSRLLAISLVTRNVVFEDIWSQELGSAIGFTSDPSSEFMWLHTATVCMKFRANDEARYVWRNYLDQGDYSKAFQIARMRQKIEPEAYEMVLRKQADFYIDEKNFTAAAEILAQSSEPFESIVLKFLCGEEDRRMGLKTLLDKKLDRMTHHEDRMKRDALVMWLLEVQLTELAEMRRTRGKEADVRETLDHVQRFLMRKNVYEAIQTNQDAVYKMCISHADFDMQFYVANAVKDTRTMMNILMLREQYIDVLELLRSQPVSEATYEMCPLLIEHVPKQLIAFFLQTDRIQPIKLLPTLSLCLKNTHMAIPALKYLEYVLNSGKPVDKLIHNLFVQLLAQHRPNKLLEYMKRYGTRRDSVPYDVEFVMRTCEQYHLEECIVFVYTVAGMYYDAVERALQIDVELAKKCARMMSENEDDDMGGLLDLNMGGSGGFTSATDREFEKRIWLKIARHVIAQEGDAKRNIELLKESNHVLSIQDILPLFPEFTKIDDFKDALTTCLKEHSEQIKELQQSMADATQTASEIIAKSDKLKNRVTVVKAGDVCSHCSRPLAGRPFFAHACRHFFHRECLEMSMQPFLSHEDQERVNLLTSEETRLINIIDKCHKDGNNSEAAAKEKQFDKISAQIGKLLGADCPLCGTIAISLIDKPFFTDEEFAEDENSWLI